MPKNANMDELHNSSLSAGSSSPRKEPSLNHRDECVSGGAEPVVQKSGATENQQICLTEVGVRQCDFDSDENLKILGRSTKNTSAELLTSHNLGYSLESANIESLEQKQDVAQGDGENSSAETGVRVSSELPVPENLEHYKEEQNLVLTEDLNSNFTTGGFRLLQENGATISAFECMGSASCYASENLGLQQSEPTEKDATNVASESGPDKGASVLTRKHKSSFLPPVCNRVLRSRSQEKPKATESKVVEVEDSANEGRKRKWRRREQMKKIPVNEFSRIRTHLRYLLHRVKYEQNLIDAYSAEGWKGQSVEKIKPEKELQRARSQIFRYKLKIRELFQHLDRSLSQGKLPESLFDSEGQIDSEDIFCAKCGSKDLTIENDIILCDGACERGFHQFCLDPPLSKEDIPPDDEGWLCPGCDCKVDCIGMLNDFQGSSLSVLDNWEKIFPEEAAAAASGRSVDENTGFPSDDSEDDDYNPDDPGLDHEVSEDESTSDVSDYFSASDEAVPPLDNKQNFSLPSDDSEDDDFDPCAPDHNQQAEEESSSSSSDFTSDSEDFGAILEDGESPAKDEGYIASVSDDGKPNPVASGKRLKAGKVKRHSLNDELSYLMESNDVPVSGKRCVERLDYRKLHDETYGDATSDSSDEDYEETAGPKRRKSSAGIQLSTHEIQDRNDGMDTMDGNQNHKETDVTVQGESHKKLKVKGSNNISSELQSSSEVGSSGKNAARPYKRLGEAVIQRLVESFRENQYPKQDAKESLARELGLRVQQVSKWFENARWSFRHSSRMESKMVTAASTNGTSVLGMDEISPGAGAGAAGNEECRISEGKSVSEVRGQKPRKKSMVDYQGSSAGNFPVQDQLADTPKSQAVPKNNRIHTRGSKSVE